jgi:hypothetical protein
VNPFSQTSHPLSIHGSISSEDSSSSDEGEGEDLVTRRRRKEKMKAKIEKKAKKLMKKRIKEESVLSSGYIKFLITMLHLNILLHNFTPST